MTAPWPPPAPHHAPPAPRPVPSAPRNEAGVIVDVVLGSLLWVALLLCGAAAVFISFLFALAGSGCYSGRCAQDGLIVTAMITVWVGTGLAGVIALAGTITCICLRKYFSYWPLIGILVVILCTGVGVVLTDRGAAGP